MSQADRFESWVDKVASGWADRLGRWTGTAIGSGIDAFAKLLGQSAAPKLKPLIDKVESLTDIPPELKPLIDEIKSPTGEVGAMLAQSAGSSLIGSAIGSVIDYLLRPLTLGLSYAPDFRLLTPEQYLVLWLRGFIDEDYMERGLRGHGFGGERIKQLKELTQIRLDPNSIITAWRRDPENYTKLLSDLKDQGWSDDRIEALKFFTLFYPPPADLIRWQAREVFEPEMRERYGLADELDRVEREPFYKAGMTDEQIDNYWYAHWEHASWMQIVEMLHRGLVTEEQVYDWFRVVEIPPFWRDLLIQTAYTWPTRVDVRRWWDMRTIDEARLRELYSGMGYRGKNLDDYVLWTKVYVAFPDLLSRWEKGWLTLDEVKSQLVDMGMPPDRVEEMIQTRITPETAERTVKERDITKTDIIKGVKQGVITRGEGAELLMDMGYDEDEAVYILEINIPRDEEDVVVSERELTKADILKGLKAEVITREGARSRLLELRYSAADAEFLLKVFDAQVEPPKEPREREASKADIVAAVKKGLITPEDAYLMLQDIDFTPEASAFILQVKAEVSPFSPRSYQEFKERAKKYQAATSIGVTSMPEEIKTAADEVVRLTGEVETLQRSIKEEERGLVNQEVLPEETTKRLTKLRVSLHRAEAELAQAKSEYDRQVAEWRHRE